MKDEIKNIIVRMPNWIGDLVMATPMLADLRKAFPEASITAMCTSPNCELLERSPDIDEMFIFRKVGIFRRREERRSIVEKLRTGKYDLGILLTNSFSSAWFFTTGKVKRRIGFRGDLRTPFLTDALPFPKDREKRHLVTVYKELLAPLGISMSDTSPNIVLGDEEIAQAKELLKTLGVPKGAKVVGVNPGAAYGSAKCWLPERFRQVVQELVKEENTYVICFGTPSLASLAEQICQGMSPRVFNLAGSTSLREMASLIKVCDAFLTNDSGPMHIAAALETPLVALFGSTNDVTTGPYGSGTVIHKHVDCSPCYKRTCPIDFRCMKSIEVREVVTAIQRKLHGK